MWGKPRSHGPGSDAGPDSAEEEQLFPLLPDLWGKGLLDARVGVCGYNQCLKGLASEAKRAGSSLLSWGRCDFCSYLAPCLKAGALLGPVEVVAAASSCICCGCLVGPRANVRGRRTRRESSRFQCLWSRCYSSILLHRPGPRVSQRIQSAGWSLCWFKMKT